MQRKEKRTFIIFSTLIVSYAASTLLAEEGMWTFDNVPVRRLREKYDFAPDAAWLEHVRLSCVRFMDGGSASFVSPRGLVLTNHHVAVGQLEKLSTAKRNLVKDGFLARTPAEEIKCPDLEVNVLVYMENVTAEIMAAVRKGMTPAEAVKARKAAQARIEKESLEKTGLRSEVISLYRGGEYWLYRYKKYTDVRLVMAPERQAAYFGGDWDNFTYPRYDLDIALVRVYENGKPLRTPHFLKWSPAGAEDGELVFVAGNPGSTKRLNTMVQLEYLRDKEYPLILKRIDRAIEALRNFARRGEEQKRRALVRLFGFGNAKKCREGELRGLRDPRLMEKRRALEGDLRKKVEADPELKRRYGSAWSRIERVYAENGEKRLLLRHQPRDPAINPVEAETDRSPLNSCPPLNPKR